MEKHIFIVEDNENVARLERLYLERSGYRVSAASSGAEALVALAGAEKPDLMVLDYYLPDMSGFDLVQSARQAGCETPYLFLSSDSTANLAVAALKGGALDYVVKDNEAIKDLPESCRQALERHSEEAETARLVADLRNLNAELIKVNKQLGEMSKRDELTGIYNRRFLMESLRYEVTRSQRFKSPLCFVIFDIDYFKAVNDTYGHIRGDLVLARFAELLRQRLRKTDLLGRLGGEEFGVILTGTPLANAVFVVEELRKLVQHTVINGAGPSLKITTSAGVAVLADGMDKDALMNMADKGLYQAKEFGRNRVVACQQEPAPSSA